MPETAGPPTLSTTHLNVLTAAELLSTVYARAAAEVKMTGISQPIAPALPRSLRSHARRCWYAFYAAALANDVGAQEDEPSRVLTLHEFDLFSIEAAYSEAVAALEADREAYTAKLAKLLLTYEERAEFYGWYGTFPALSVASIRRWLLSLTPGFADAPKDV